MPFTNINWRFVAFVAASGINIILAIIEKHVCGHVNVQKTIYVNNNNVFGFRVIAI